MGKDKPYNSFVMDDVLDAVKERKRKRENLDEFEYNTKKKGRKKHEKGNDRR